MFPNPAQHTRKIPVRFATAMTVLILCASAPCTTIAHWRFEEGPVGSGATTSVLDSSGNGLHGTPIGGSRGTLVGMYRRTGTRHTQRDLRTLLRHPVK